MFYKNALYNFISIKYNTKVISFIFFYLHSKPICIGMKIDNIFHLNFFTVSFLIITETKLFFLDFPIHVQFFLYVYDNMTIFYAHNILQFLINTTQKEFISHIPIYSLPLRITSTLY